jgi:hypothetical protein
MLQQQVEECPAPTDARGEQSVDDLAALLVVGSVFGSRPQRTPPDHPADFGGQQGAHQRTGVRWISECRTKQGIMRRCHRGPRPSWRAYSGTWHGLQVRCIRASASLDASGLFRRDRQSATLSP